MALHGALPLQVRIERGVIGLGAGRAKSPAHPAAHHREKLAGYRKIEAGDFPPTAPSREQRLRHLVLKAGIEFESRRVVFCQEAIAILRTR
jgi:hypothetical protein